MINKINYEQFRKEFLATPIGQQVLQDFDEVTCTNTHYPSILVVAHGHQSTCRELLGSREMKSINQNTTISIVTFYYLQFLQEKNPKLIYDIGCGWNIWKKYIPNIVGIDNKSQYADIKDEYNTHYVDKNNRNLESAFAVNMSSSIHINPDTGQGNPITFSNLTECIKEFSSIISSGGRGYIALPAIAPLISTSDEWFEDNDLTRYAISELTNYLEQKILSLDCIKVIALDIELDILKHFPSHDGEIRVVFEVL
jgi:hypothetical protein